MRRTALIAVVLSLYVASQALAQDPIYAPFGQGCGAGGFALPSLDGANGSLPTIDDRFTVLLRDLPFKTAAEPGAVVILLGFSSSQWLGFPLPLDLNNLGAPGCTWYVSGQQVFAQNYSGDTASWVVDIPNTPSLIGSHIFNQGVVLDPGANPLGLVTTNAAEGVIGLNRGPEASIIFPPPRSLTNQDSIQVRGKANDQDGIAEVRVNGLLATTSDGYANWELKLPLAAGTTAITVQTLDSLGFLNREVASAQIESQARLDFPGGLAFDPLSSTAFVTSRDSIVALDLNSGNRTVLSDRTHGSGKLLTDIRGIALDGNRLLVTGTTPSWGVVEVNLSTGARRTITDATIGSGPSLSSPWGIVRQGGEVVVVVRDFDMPSNRFFGEVLGVSLTSGSRRVILSGNAGAGNRLIKPIGIALDGSRVLVTDESRQSIFTVDLLNGGFGILSGGFTGVGPPLANPIGIAVDGNRALVVQKALASLYSVDLATGNRTLVSGATRGAGEDFISPWAVVKAGTGALVTDRDLQAVISIDLSTGDRAVLARSSVGTGSPLQGQTAVILDQGRLLVLDGRAQAIVQIDRSTGNRRVISDRNHGTGPSMFNPTAFTVAGDGAYVIDEDLDAMFAVDLRTGNRRVISDSRIGNGQPLAWPTGVAMYGAQALVIDRNLLALMSVDLTTGDRVVVSSQALGSGPQLLQPVAIAIDENRALILDQDGSVSPNEARIIAIDLATGDRVILSDGQRGTGPRFSFPSSMTLDGDRVLLSNGTILAIDTATGDRTTIAIPKPESLFFSGTGVVVEGSQAILISNSLRTVTSVDLQTSEQVIISK